MRTVNNGPMLNAYPDSMGGKLGDIATFLGKEELKDVFSSFYILPSLFNTDLDRGFSVVDYSLNDLLAKREDIDALSALDLDLKLDFILNHASVLSPQFQDLIQNGENSKYKDFFINWNQFWEGYGSMTEEGYIQPDAKYLEHMFFRKAGLPILMVRFPDGKDVPYWNTFYQEISYPRFDTLDIMKELGVQYCVAKEISDAIEKGLDAGKIPQEMDILPAYKACVCDILESKRRYLGQMDLNIKSDLVWDFYDDTLRQLADYGAKIVRLDAFAYAPKEPGEKNFLNEPSTWDVLERVKKLADNYSLNLLPEIHASYGEKIYETIANKGYMTYDFFLPGLMIEALHTGDGTTLLAWANEIYDKKMQTVNMLGCHDGIPLLDLKGLISDVRIQNIIDLVVGRGGYVKDLHGQKNVYYQVNATFFSAIGEEEDALLLARALQLFMPGKPQIWYLDLFAGKNDYGAVKRAGAAGHKEINRTNLGLEDMQRALESDVVKRQLDLLRFRNTYPAFGFDATFCANVDKSLLSFTWKKNGYEAILVSDLSSHHFRIMTKNPDGGSILFFEN